jgi:hypothetical protein
MGGHRDEETGKYVAYSSALERYRWKNPVPPSTPPHLQSGFNYAMGFAVTQHGPSGSSVPGRMTMEGLLQDLEDANHRVASALRFAHDY